MSRWQKFVSREGVDLTTIEYIDKTFFNLIHKFTNSKKESFFTILENKNFTHYTKIDIHKLGRFYYQKYYFRPAQIVRWYLRGQKDIKANNKIVKFWQKKLRKDCEKELILALAEFKKIYLKFNYYYSILPFVSFESWQKDFETSLSVVLSNTKPQQKKLIAASLIRPWKKTYIAKIKENIKRGNAREVLDDSQFLRSWSVIWYQPLRISWIKSLKSGASKSQNYISNKKLIKIFNPNKELKKFILVAPYVTFYKDWRDELRRRQIYSWSFLFDIISKKLRVSRRGLGYLTLDEIKNSLLLGRVEKGKIEKRASRLILVTSVPNTTETMVVDDNLESYLKIIQELNLMPQEAAFVKGIVVSVGHAVGRVKIIKNAENLAALKRGEVLVSNTTHPNYLAAMAKSCAIVTNEGGIVCHAAITAREMRKPCVVSTKIATKVFKDGDYVEVDANHGIVRRIK